MNENKIQPMYETTPAIASLNQVPGFNPLKFLRRTMSENNEPVMQLDLRYKKLWFRLANPHGRIRLVNLHITEQLAIIEAKIFLNRNDTAPISSFTARCTACENEKYLEAAQNKALNEALSNAGYGLQFSDINVGTNGEPYGSVVPLTEPPLAQTVVENAAKLLNAEVHSKQSLPVIPPTAEEHLPVDNTAGQNNDPLPQTLPVTTETKNSAAPVKETKAQHLPANQNNQITVLNGGKTPEPPSIADSAKEALAVMTGQSETKTEAINEHHQEPTFAQTHTQTMSPSAYSADMPVDQLIKLMTVEEAGQILVDIGTCNGWTMAQVAERRAPSLRWYVFGYQGNNNILRAAAQVMLDSLEAQKAS